MQGQFARIRNKLMVACSLAVAAVLAAPAAMAHDGYRGGGHSGDVLGALVVGAVIGGVIASASHDRYDNGGYYYPAQPQAYGSAYYGGYPAYTYPAYPAYSYGGGYGYPAYGGGVNVGVVYNSGGGYRRGDNRGYYRGSYGYGQQQYRGNRGNSNWRRGDGHYYSRHGR